MRLLALRAGVRACLDLAYLPNQVPHSFFDFLCEAGDLLPLLRKMESPQDYIPYYSKSEQRWVLSPSAGIAVVQVLDDRDREVR